MSTKTQSISDKELTEIYTLLSKKELINIILYMRKRQPYLGDNTNTKDSNYTDIN